MPDLPPADIYVSTIDPGRYWKENTSRLEKVLKKLKGEGWEDVAVSFGLPAPLAHGLWIYVNWESFVPSVPMTMFPQPSDPGLFPINEPGDSSLVLLTGNSSITLEVVFSVLGQGKTPLWLLSVDCGGNTVDMAMVYGSMSPDTVKNAMDKWGLPDKIKRRELLIPGFVAPLREEIESLTGWRVVTGPVSIVELPLFLGRAWIPPGDPKPF